MISLYVCLFSNGHLKVGRSVNAFRCAHCLPADHGRNVRVVNYLDGKVICGEEDAHV